MEDSADVIGVLRKVGGGRHREQICNLWSILEIQIRVKVTVLSLNSRRQTRSLEMHVAQSFYISVGSRIPFLGNLILVT